MDNPPCVCSRWLSFAVRRAGRSILLGLAALGDCTVAVPMHEVQQSFPRAVWAPGYCRRGIAELEQMLVTAD